VATRTIDISDAINIASTIRGAKNPVMVGPTEAWWTTRTPVGPGTIQLNRTTDTAMAAEAWGPGAKWLLDQAPRLIGCDDDLTGFEPEGKIRDFWRRNPFKLARTDRPWDAIIGGVFGQKVQVANAVKARRLLARKFGEPAPGPRQGWVLPSPQRVGEMGYHDFHRLGVERKRAETLIRVGREMRRMTNLSEIPPADAAARLQRIRGIGGWTANMVRWRVIRLAKANSSAPKYGPKLSLTDDGLHRGR